MRRSRHRRGDERTCGKLGSSRHGIFGARSTRCEQMGTARHSASCSQLRASRSQMLLSLEGFSKRPRRHRLRRFSSRRDGSTEWRGRGELAISAMRCRPRYIEAYGGSNDFIDEIVDERIARNRGVPRASLRPRSVGGVVARARYEARGTWHLPDGRGGAHGHVTVCCRKPRGRRDRCEVLDRRALRCRTRPEGRVAGREGAIATSPPSGLCSCRGDRRLEAAAGPRPRALLP